MWYLEVIILSSCIYFSNALGFYDLDDHYGLFERKLNRSGESLNLSVISTKWIEQPLDHFDNSETRTWAMRYFERLDLWQPNGPIYIFINGEWTAQTHNLRFGLFHDLAKETKGAMYATEHRYYGESMPFEVLTTENLAYLSSRQALADVARLLKIIKRKPSLTNSKVVVVGGSYAGNLAAWMKVLYPDLVDAVIASSAPVLAKKDFYEYYDTVSKDFMQYGGQKCYEDIKIIFNRYDTLLKTSNGIAQLKKEENICARTNMTKSVNKQLFFSLKLGLYAKYAKRTPEDIRLFCLLFTNPRNDSSLNEVEVNLWNDLENCFDCDLDSFVDALKKNDKVFSWTYQICTEFGHLLTTTHERYPFTDNVHTELFIKTCIKMFGSQFDENRIDKGISYTNRIYGGLRPNVTNVVFVNGDMDPWHRVGVVKDMSDNVRAIVIPGASHCKDLAPDDDEDSEKLRAARKNIKSLIKSWINVNN